MKLLCRTVLGAGTLFAATFFPALGYADHHHSSSSSSSSESHCLGEWTEIVSMPPFSGPFPGAGAPLLLTDGSVLMQNFNGPPHTGEIWKLTPDMYGSYINGTWTQLASLPSGYAPLYYASAVLPDGRVIFVGGEYNGPDYDVEETNLGAIYDPVVDAWTPIAGPPFFTNLFSIPPYDFGPPNAVGDAPSVVLEDGTFMLGQGALAGAQTALLDAKTLTWTQTGLDKVGNQTKYDFNSEEGWTLLPDGKVLTIDVYVNFNNPDFPPPIPYPPYPSNPVNSELYDPKTGTWSTAGTTKVALTDPLDTEMGPAVLRPDGTVFAVGSNGNTAIYDTRTHKWSVGPSLPYVPGEGQLGTQDGPGALLPNGSVLFAAGPIAPVYSPPMHIFEFDGKRLIEQPTIRNASIDPSYYGNMVILPTGQVLMTDFSDTVQIFTSCDKNYKKEWAPVITSGPKKIKPGNTYKIEGIRFNGMSQGSAYGDDYQSATNYPLVRITNLETGHVFYSRTHDHSYMGVASDKKVHTYFDVPYNQELGKSKLEVVANGIPSKPVYISVQS